MWGIEVDSHVPVCKNVYEVNLPFNLQQLPFNSKVENYYVQVSIDKKLIFLFEGMRNSVYFDAVLLCGVTSLIFYLIGRICE